MEEQYGRGEEIRTLTTNQRSVNLAQIALSHLDLGTAQDLVEIAGSLETAIQIGTSKSEETEEAIAQAQREVEMLRERLDDHGKLIWSHCEAHDEIVSIVALGGMPSDGYALSLLINGDEAYLEPVKILDLNAMLFLRARGGG